MSHLLQRIELHSPNYRDKHQITLEIKCHLTRLISPINTGNSIKKIPEPHSNSP